MDHQYYKLLAKKQDDQIQQLQKENSQLKKENLQLQKENAHVKKEIAQLKELVTALKDQLNTDSHNSSKPPSSDGLKKKTKSLRKPSDKNPGGQKGHKGNTLERVEEPDHTVTHQIDKCSKCGFSLDSERLYNIENHQVFDIPQLKMEVTQHQGEVKKCPKCGTINKAQFPTQASNIVQYGSGINGLVSYLSNYQLIPQKRVTEFFTDLFNHPLSKATVIKMNKTTYQALQSFGDTAKEKLINSRVLHADESGFYCEGKRQWLHSASTQTTTYYQFHPKRGKVAMDEIGILPHFGGTLVHDFWSPYMNYSCLHGLCNTHHLRELVFLIEQKDRQWASHMKTLLLEIKERVDQEKLNHRESLTPEVIKLFEDLYDQIIKKGIQDEPPPPPAPDQAELPKKRGRKKKSKSMNLLIRFKEHKEKVLAFMYDFEVPFDNNLAERDIRMIKVKQKISGTFRTGPGAKAFCRIRSYISTVRKNDINVLKAISKAIGGKPFIPT